MLNIVGYGLYIKYLGLKYWNLVFWFFFDNFWFIFALTLNKYFIKKKRQISQKFCKKWEKGVKIERKGKRGGEKRTIKRKREKKIGKEKRERDEIWPYFFAVLILIPW